MSNSNSNTIFVGVNTDDYDDVKYAQGLARYFDAMGIIHTASAEALKADIASRGNNDLKIVFKITVEAVEYVGQKH